MIIISLTFLNPNFLGEGSSPNFLQIFLHIWITIRHTAKYDDERPSDIGNYAAKTNKEEEINVSGKT